MHNTSSCSCVEYGEGDFLRNQEDLMNSKEFFIESEVSKVTAVESRLYLGTDGRLAKRCWLGGKKGGRWLRASDKTRNTRRSEQSASNQ